MNILDANKVKVGDHVQISGKKYLISHRTEQMFAHPTFRVELKNGPMISYGFALAEFFEGHFPAED